MFWFVFFIFFSKSGFFYVFFDIYIFSWFHGILFLTNSKKLWWKNGSKSDKKMTFFSISVILPLKFMFFDQKIYKLKTENFELVIFHWFSNVLVGFLFFFFLKCYFLLLFSKFIFWLGFMVFILKQKIIHKNQKKLLSKKNKKN